MSKYITIAEILKANPELDASRIADVAKLLDSMQRAGVAKNVYGIKSRLSSHIDPPGERRKALKLSR